jgi:KUP system potassium uptake protein
VPGTAVFLTRQDHGAPAAIVEHLESMGALHSNVVVLTVLFEPTPRIADADRSRVEFLGEGIWRVTICFGFVEVPDLEVALRAVKGLGADIDLESAIYFGNRDLVTRRPALPRLPAWRVSLFAFLYRNAVKAVDRFNLPSDHVLEIARQLEI